MLLYTIVTMVTLCAVATVAVDWGRCQVAKTELQGATDAAARYAVVGMKSTMQNTSGASANAASVMAANLVDGQPAPFNAATDLSIGVWDAAAKTFVTTNTVSAANAVRIESRLTLGNAAGRAPMFLNAFGRVATVRAVSIAVMNGQDSTTYVSAKGNPWLAGMPAGTCCTDFQSSSANWDYAGTTANDQSSPASIPLSSLGIASGASMIFDGVTGSANFGTGSTNSNADGDATKHVNLGSTSFGSYANFTSPINGMSNCHAPINAMVAVFLDDNNPSSTAAPSPLDFATAASRDFQSLSPQLKQVFFVGDGRRSTGEVQQFVVPTGATRLFIANIDGYQYNNNIGGYNLTVHGTQAISTVYAE